VEIDSVTVGSAPILMASMALFDTGTSFTYLSKTAYPQFVAAVSPYTFLSYLFISVPSMGVPITIPE
jgi:hypothetical protein